MDLGRVDCKDLVTKAKLENRCMLVAIIFKRKFMCLNSVSSYLDINGGLAEVFVMDGTIPVNYRGVVFMSMFCLLIFK